MTYPKTQWTPIGQIQKFDVISVRLASHKVTMLAKNKTAEEAKAFIDKRIARWGLETEYFVMTKPDVYCDNDSWEGPEGPKRKVNQI